MTIVRPAALSLTLVALLVACKDTREPTPTAPAPTAPATAAATPTTPAAAPTPPPAAADDGCADLRDNKGVAACEAACAAGSARACTFAGELHIEEDDEAVADGNALPLFQKGCDGGDGEGCRMVGVFHRGGLAGLAKDEAKMKEYYVRALPLFDKECEAGNKVSCNFAGGFYATGEGGAVAADPAKALARWKRGCELGLPGACDSAKKAEAGAAGATP